jgi:hypothetical protein
MRAPIVLSTLLYGSLFVTACKPPPVVHPDRDKVVAAQKEWCDMLGELAGEGWMHQKDCEAAFPGASAQFLSRMSKCYGQQMKEYGDNAPDSGAIIGDCTQQVLAGVDPGDVFDTVAGRARCSRQQRCQAVSIETCQSVLDRLDGATKATLTNIYNLRAQHDLATCLAEGKCDEDNDEEAMNACYRGARDGMLWLPLAL